MSRIKITIKELTDYLKSKKCKTPYPKYIAETILKNADHSIGYKHEDDFSLREIFDHIEIIDEPTNTSDMSEN